MGARSDGRSYARLNPGQIQCMLLVGDHLTSKEIAQRLGISPHTVDQRVRRVLRVTGAGTRREAARLIKQRIEAEAQCETVTEPLATIHPGKAMKVNAAPQRWAGWMLPFPTYDGQLNDMGLGQRIFWIIAIAVGACVSSAMYLAGLESLARLMRAY